CLAIGRHRAIELEEVRVALKGFGEDPVTLGLTLTADDLRLALGGSEDFNHFAVGTGANAGSRLAAACTKALGFGKTLGLHALVGLLRNFGCQVGPANAHVDNTKSKCCR